MNWLALNDNLVIELYEAEAVSDGGIIIPDTAKEKPDKGTVVSIGVDVKDKNIVNGSVVYMVKGAAAKNPVELDGKLYYIVKGYDVQLCIPPNQN